MPTSHEPHSGPVLLADLVGSGPACSDFWFFISNAPCYPQECMRERNGDAVSILEVHHVKPEIEYSTLASAAFSTTTKMLLLIYTGRGWNTTNANNEKNKSQPYHRLALLRLRPSDVDARIPLSGAVVVWLLRYHTEQAWRSLPFHDLQSRQRTQTCFQPRVLHLIGQRPLNKRHTA